MSGEDALRVFVPSRFGFKGSGWGALVDEFVYEDKGTEPSICSESVTGVECHQDSNQAWQRQRTKCFFCTCRECLHVSETLQNLHRRLLTYQSATPVDAPEGQALEPYDSILASRTMPWPLNRRSDP